VLRLAAALQQAGARVDIIAPGAKGLPHSHHIDGVHITRVRYASDTRMTLAYTGTMAEAVAGSWSGRLALLQLLWAMRRAVGNAVQRARREGAPYDALHVHWWFPSGLALLGATKSWWPPLVITMHGSDVRLAAAKPAAHPLMRAVLQRAVARTAVSSWLADTATRIAGVPVDVAPMPVDVGPLAINQGATSERDDTRRGVLFVGRLNAQKGLDDVLHALAQPAAQTLTLDVVGDGPDASALRARAEALGVSARVTWHGHLSQQELLPRYARARVVAMPSRGEGLGLVAVEAQLAGTPVVAYADAGLPDVVDPAHGGTLVPVGDIPALAAALSRVASADSPDRERMRQFVLQRFAPESVAARYLALYNEARPGRRPASVAR
jgi:glycosyltransferase involved in cell wall biosynthesis